MASKKRHNKVEYRKAAVLDDCTFRITRWDVPIGQKAGPLDANDLGMLDEENLCIHVRWSGSRRDILKIIFHELLHLGLGSDYTRVSEARLKRAERMVDDLESLGVDLSPLIEGYE
jgi:hypothetical protein